MAGIPRFETALQAIDELIAFRMAPLNVRRAARTERTYALLVSAITSPHSASAGSAASSVRTKEKCEARNRSSSFRTITGNRFGGRRRDRPDAAGKRQPAHDRGRCA